MTSATANYAIASDMAVQLQQCARKFVLQVQVDGKTEGAEGRRAEKKPDHRSAGGLALESR